MESYVHWKEGKELIFWSHRFNFSLSLSHRTWHQKIFLQLIIYEMEIDSFAWISLFWWFITFQLGLAYISHFSSTTVWFISHKKLLLKIFFIVLMGNERWEPIWLPARAHCLWFFIFLFLFLSEWAIFASKFNFSFCFLSKTVKSVSVW